MLLSWSIGNLYIYIALYSNGHYTINMLRCVYLDWCVGGNRIDCVCGYMSSNTHIRELRNVLTILTVVMRKHLISIWALTSIGHWSFVIWMYTRKYELTLMEKRFCGLCGFVEIVVRIDCILRTQEWTRQNFIHFVSLVIYWLF